MTDAETDTVIAGELGSPKALSLADVAESLLETHDKLGMLRVLNARDWRRRLGR